MPWACGEKYYYSLDTDKNKKQADDPGTLVVDNLRTRERIRCDLWKDEINNLLIFVSSIWLDTSGVPDFFGLVGSVLCCRYRLYHRVLQRPSRGPK